MTLCVDIFTPTYERQHYCEKMNAHKRFKPNSTVLEQLPNELFIEIFTYLTNVDVVYSFSQLNIRLQDLILSCCYTFDFKSINKAKLDLVIQRHNPQRWRSLRLSNDDETPGQIDYFCRFYPLDQHVSQLKAISLIDVKPHNDTLLFSQLRSFVNLISLTIKSAHGFCLSPLYLPSLKHLVLTSCINNEWIKNFSCLETLDYTIEEHRHRDLSFDEYTSLWPRTLKQLKISFYRNGYEELTHTLILIRKLMRPLSNLICLKIDVSSDYNTSPDGERWEELIRSSLLSLKKFQFYFVFRLSAGINIDPVIASFSTPFYLHEKRWFIRCDTNVKTGSACLYSLPFVFEHFSIETYSFDTSITTLLNDNNSNKNMYKNIRTLIFNNPCSEPHLTLRPDHIDGLVFNTYFLPDTWLPMLTRLRHLSIGSIATITSDSLIHLLAYTTELYHLTIEIDNLLALTDDWKNSVLCNLFSNKIRRLDLVSRTNLFSNSRNCIKPKTLQNIVRIFGMNCEHLTICLESHHMVETFILPYMKKLRSLNVSGTFDRVGRTFVMNSVEQWQISGDTSTLISADQDSFQIWFHHQS